MEKYFKDRESKFKEEKKRKASGTSLVSLQYLRSIKLPDKTGIIRIALSTNKDQLNFSSFGKVELLEKKGDLITKIATVQGDFSIQKQGNLLRIVYADGKSPGSVSGVIQVKSFNQYNIIEAEHRTYRGYFEVSHTNNNHLLLVNVIGLENYLRGVLPSEMPATDRGILEALKAQAVAARTYAVAHQGQYKNMSFDLYHDQRDQVYKGVRTETFISDKAISETSNIVLTYDAKLAKCFYHSTCGGKTANIHDVWGQRTKHYLSTRSDANPNGLNYCKASKYSTWHESWSLPKLSQIVRINLASAKPDKMLKFTRIKGLEVTKRAACGRVKNLKITTDNGVINIRGDKTRWALRRDMPGNPILLSAWFEIENFGPKVLIRGRGFGHGIGMCQRGAMGRAREGQNFIDILEAYYRSAELARWELKE
ncbi:MAG: SpoIID/LytB domain-containing protein [Fibrobacteria bacterium]|nr:SpoIID/LytB domain-containing protein [Fibrobacteria bacterium]